VRVEQEPKRRDAAHSLSSVTGRTTSPTIVARPAMMPSQSLRAAGTRGGATSATGWPKRVMSTGLRVRFTRWRTARQVALNFDTGMLSMAGKLAWSEIMVK
jgi:hypothetical protein